VLGAFTKIGISPWKWPESEANHEVSAQIAIIITKGSAGATNKKLESQCDFNTSEPVLV